MPGIVLTARYKEPTNKTYYSSSQFVVKSTIMAKCKCACKCQKKKNINGLYSDCFLSGMYIPYQFRIAGSFIYFYFPE